MVLIGCVRCCVGRCLERWLCEGVVDDPFAEFMIQENPVRALLHIRLPIM